MKMYCLDCGHLGGRLKDFIEGEQGEIDLPVGSYLIEHPKGRVLFDTGMHPDLQTRPEDKLGAVARLFNFEHFRPGDEIGARLKSIGRDPATVDVVNQLTSALRPRRRQRPAPQRDVDRAAPRLGNRP